MDAKASAKSKRAHTLQAKRAHSHPHPKNSKPSVGNPKKPQKQKNSDKTHQSHLLPSNWDRYDEDEGLGNNDSTDSRLAEGIPTPKSKGANLAELISRAQEEARTRLNLDTDCFVAFDDALSGFYQGVGSMLSAKGNSLLSWSGHDNFITDDGETSTYEASYLSLDLHALAAQLEKIDVSERLFIESDLLGEELCEQSKDTSSLCSDHGETSHATGTDKSSLGHNHEETSPVVGRHNMPKNLGNDNEVVLYASTCCKNLQDNHNHHQTMQGANERSFPAFTWQSGKSDSVDSEPFHHDGAADVLEPISEPRAAAELKNRMNLRSATAPAEAALDMHLSRINETKENGTLGFEAAAAEAELDHLLDSFGEGWSNNLKRAQYNSSTTFLKESSALMGAQPVRQSPDFPKNASMTGTHDEIDSLLAAAPIMSNQDPEPHPESITSKALPSSPSGPNVLDDFDSWLDTL